MVHGSALHEHARSGVLVALSRRAWAYTHLIVDATHRLTTLKARYSKGPTRGRSSAIVDQSYRQKEERKKRGAERKEAAPPIVVYGRVCPKVGKRDDCGRCKNAAFSHFAGAVVFGKISVIFSATPPSSDAPQLFLTPVVCLLVGLFGREERSPTLRSCVCTWSYPPVEIRKSGVTRERKGIWSNQRNPLNLVRRFCHGTGTR